MWHDGREILLTPAMQEKLKILNMHGFESHNPRVLATLLNQHPRNTNDRFRTKCFLREEDRVRAHLNVVKRSKSSQQEDALSEPNTYGDISIGDLDAKVYVPPVPIIPYPHQGKHVLPDGFARDAPNLAQRVLKRYKKWFKARGYPEESAQAGTQNDNATSTNQENMNTQVSAPQLSMDLSSGKEVRSP